MALEARYSGLTGTSAVTANDVQTLVNKSLQDSTTTLVDDADATKKLKLQLSGITTGTTRTLTVPDATDTINVIGTAQTITGAKTFGSTGSVGKLKVAGTTSGSTIVDATAIASGTLTLPAATDTLVGKATTDTLTNKTLTDPAGTGFVLSKTITFTEDATSTTHTGTVALPAGSTLHNIQVVNTALWTGGTATLKVGDDDDDDGWFTGVNMKATDLLVGEVLDITNAENWGGVNGAYLVAGSGLKGTAQASNAGVYYGASNNVIAVITVGTPATTVGRTFMTVTYSVGAVTAATAA